MGATFEYWAFPTGAGESIVEQHEIDRTVNVNDQGALVVGSGNSQVIVHPGNGQIVVRAGNGQVVVEAGNGQVVVTSGRGQLIVDGKLQG